MTEVLLDVRDLRVRYGGRTAVNGVSFVIRRGETLGLVGESGCGKSSIARALLRLQSSEGGILLHGRDLNALSERALRPLRREFQAVFQDPMASLNPRMRVGEILAEPLKLHRRNRDAEAEVNKWLKRIGLDADFADHYPHELSGGQAQRVAIARALITEPSLVICDEPVSALDMSVRGQILGLLESLRRELGIALLFIAHDMSAVRYLCDRVLVMYAGRIVESGSRDAVFKRPAHPYTRQLLEAVLPPDPDRQPPRDVTQSIDADVAVTGCAFAPRCPGREEICARENPEIREWQARDIACHFPDENQKSSQ